MVLRSRLSLVAISLGLVLAGCAYEPSYTYQTVPCEPSGDATAPPTAVAPAPQSSASSAPDPSSTAAALAEANTPRQQVCMVAVPNQAMTYTGGYWGYAPYGYYGWPYYGYGWPYYGYGVGFIGGGFHHFHGHGFHGGHSHGGGSHGGGHH